MKISFIVPSRNNLKYLKQCVQSITYNYGTEHDIVLLDDASTDGTWEWINSLEQDNIIKYRNEGPERVGHTILYDVGVSLSNTEVFTIFHADMITSPEHIPNSLKYLAPKTVVAATRIEPPLHPPGPEKIVKDFGMEPENFKWAEYYTFCKENAPLVRGISTKGIFAPWLMYKKDFEDINGHDPLFAPMELEDSDIFNRMHLAGYNLIQARDSFVYHMTCRGSRFKNGLEIEKVIPLQDGTFWHKPKDSEEYTKLRQLKFREWWRKWAMDVLHDNDMYPVVPSRIHKSAIIYGCNINSLATLEPWFDNIIIDCDASSYIEQEQPNTLYNLKDKINNLDATVNIRVTFNVSQFTNKSYEVLKQMNFILSDAEEGASYEIDIFKIDVFKVVNMNTDLIKNLIGKK